MVPDSLSLSAPCISFIRLDVACCWPRCFLAEAMLCLYPASGLKLRPRVCSRFARWTRGPERNVGRATGRDEVNSHGRVRNVAAIVAAEDVRGHLGQVPGPDRGRVLVEDRGRGTRDEVSRQAWVNREPRTAFMKP